MTMSDVGRRRASHGRHPTGTVDPQDEPTDTHRSQRVESIPVTSSTTVARPPQVLLPRLRSRGGWGAGSSDQPGRRNPRADSHRDDRAYPRPKSSFDAERPVTGAPVEFIGAARAELLVQRSFRVGQMEPGRDRSCGHGTDPARAEIHVALRIGTRSGRAILTGPCIGSGEAIRMLPLDAATRCPRAGWAPSLWPPERAPCHPTQGIHGCPEQPKPKTGAPGPHPHSSRRAMTPARPQPRTNGHPCGSKRS